MELCLGIGLESSSEDDYEEPSEEENENDAVNFDGPVIDNAPIDYGFDDDFVGNSNFTLESRRDIYLLKGWRAFVLKRPKFAGFLVPDPRATHCRKIKLGQKCRKCSELATAI